MGISDCLTSSRWENSLMGCVRISLTSIEIKVFMSITVADPGSFSKSLNRMKNCLLYADLYKIESIQQR
jgi:hypothetical protein